MGLYTQNYKSNVISQ